MAAQLAQHGLDALERAKRLAAAHAGVGLGFVDDPRPAALLAHPQAGLESQCVFGAGFDAQAALHAVFLDEAQLGPLGVVLQGTGRAGADAAQAQGAGIGIHHHAAQRRGGGQGDGVALRGGLRLQSAGGLLYQVIQRQLQGGALARLDGKAGRFGHALSSGRGQGGIQLGQIAGIAHFQQAQVLAAVAQAGQDGLGHVHLGAHGAAVLGGFGPGHQHPHLRGSVGQGRQPHLQPHRGGVPQRHRNHPCWQATQAAVIGLGWLASPQAGDAGHRPGWLLARWHQRGGAAQLVEQGRPGLLAVEQQRRLLATRLGVGGQQGVQLAALVGRARIGVAQRPGGAHRGAGAAAHAQVGVDLDLLALDIARDGRGRTHVHAGVAAHLAVAAMGADRGFVFKELGLFKLAHRTAQLHHHGHQRSGVGPRLDVPVALWRRVLGEGGAGAQIQHQVEGVGVGGGGAAKVDGSGHLALRHAGAVALAAGHVHLVVQPDGIFRAGGHAGVAAGTQIQVDGVAGFALQGERTQPARELPDRASQHGVAALLAACAAGGQHGHIQHIGHQRGHALGGLQCAHDQQAALALVGHGGHGVGVGQVGGGQQRGNFGRGGLRLTRPAAGFADIDKPDGAHVQRHGPFGLGRQLAEQAALLRAGHHQLIGVARRFLECACLAAAQGAVQGQRFIKRLTQCHRVEGHGLVAVADQGGHGQKSGEKR